MTEQDELDNNFLTRDEIIKRKCINNGLDILPEKSDNMFDNINNFKQNSRDYVDLTKINEDIVENTISDYFDDIPEIIVMVKE